MKPLVSLSVALLLLIAAVEARAEKLKMEIVGPGSKAFPIALPGLKDLGGDGQREISGTFIDTLSRDLKLSGYFRVIDPQSYIEDPQKSGFEPGQFNMSDWSQLNAAFLVKGSAQVTGGQVSLEARLYDVAEQRQMMGKRYTGGGADVARMARRFADAIMKAVTGVPGPFDTKVAFSSTRGGRFKEVYTASIDGGDLFKVTNNPTINIFPSFDRSGQRLLYTSFKSRAPELYLADLAARREIKITSTRGFLIDGALSSDGTRIAAVVEQNGASNLYLLDSSGHEIRALTNGSINVGPAFSPDGSKLAFASDRSGAPQIYIMDLNGDQPHRITYHGNYNTTPSFSPKGDRIAYQSRESGRFNIYVIGLDGGEPVRLTEGAGSNESPSWSPDGRYLLFSSTRDGRTHMYLMRSDGGKVISTLLEDRGDDTSPSWSWWLPE